MPATTATADHDHGCLTSVLYRMGWPGLGIVGPSLLSEQSVSALERSTPAPSRAVRPIGAAPQLFGHQASW